jgi:hypothetical protein
MNFNIPCDYPLKLQFKLNLGLYSECFFMNFLRIGYPNPTSRNVWFLVSEC